MVDLGGDTVLGYVSTQKVFAWMKCVEALKPGETLNIGEHND